MTSDWIVQKISSLGDFDRGKSKHRPRDAKHLYGGTHPFIQTGDITNSGGRITSYRQTYSDAGLAQSKLWPAGTLAITIAANIAETALLTFPACFPDSVVGFTADPKKSDVRFVEYLFQAMRKQVKSHAYGSAQENINLAVLRNLEFPIPPLPIQVIIADYLSLLDDRITLLRETNQTLEAIAQALFKSWFVDFDPVRSKAEGRVPEGIDAETAALFPDAFEETELGQVPKGWRIASVGEIVNVTDYVANGSFAALKRNVTLLDEPSYALYLRTTDFNSGFSSRFRYVDKSAYDFLSKSSLDGSEVIISNVGDVGTVFRPPSWLGIPMTLGSNAVALKNPEMSNFLYFYFTGPIGQREIQSIVTGSAQLKFNKTNFRALRIKLPDRKCLALFESNVNNIWLRIANNLAQAQSLTNIRDALLPHLISGRLL